MDNLDKLIELKNMVVGQAEILHGEIKDYFNKKIDKFLSDIKMY